MSFDIYLFDIDGTLVSTGGAGRRAMGAALQDVLNVEAPLEGISLGGMTDRLILRKVLKANAPEIDFSDALFEEVVSNYVSRLGEEVEGSDGYRNFVEPAYFDAYQSEEIALGLGTGNVEQGARIKLARAKLDSLFAFGGFGEDAEDRGLLIRIGAERGARALGRPLTACTTVIIGDTVHDIHAARAIGAKVVAVTTGSDSEETLRAERPDLLVDSLHCEEALSFLGR